MPTAAETTWSWAWPWWGTLVAINVVNVMVGIVLFIRSARDDNPANAGYLRMMRTMGIVFVCVAFYRSIFVSSYLEQLAWFDSVLNSSLLIRCLAIFAGNTTATIVFTCITAAVSALNAGFDPPSRAKRHGDASRAYNHLLRPLSELGYKLYSLYTLEYVPETIYAPDGSYREVWRWQQTGAPDKAEVEAVWAGFVKLRERIESIDETAPSLTSALPNLSGLWPGRSGAREGGGQAAQLGG